VRVSPSEERLHALLCSYSGVYSHTIQKAPRPAPAVEVVVKVLLSCS
jgi:hypothetical protein